MAFVINVGANFKVPSKAETKALVKKIIKDTNGQFNDKAIPIEMKLGADVQGAAKADLDKMFKEVTKMINNLSKAMSEEIGKTLSTQIETMNFQIDTIEEGVKSLSVSLNNLANTDFSELLKNLEKVANIKPNENLSSGLVQATNNAEELVKNVKKVKETFDAATLSAEEYTRKIHSQEEQVRRTKNRHDELVRLQKEATDYKEFDNKKYANASLSDIQKEGRAELANYKSIVQEFEDVKATITHLQNDKTKILKIPTPSEQDIQRLAEIRKRLNELQLTYKDLKVRRGQSINTALGWENLYSKKFKDTFDKEGKIFDESDKADLLADLSDIKNQFDVTIGKIKTDLDGYIAQLEETKQNGRKLKSDIKTKDLTTIKITPELDIDAFTRQLATVIEAAEKYMTKLKFTLKPNTTDIDKVINKLQDTINRTHSLYVETYPVSTDFEKSEVFAAKLLADMQKRLNQEEDKLTVNVTPVINGKPVFDGNTPIPINVAPVSAPPTTPPPSSPTPPPPTTPPTNVTPPTTPTPPTPSPTTPPTGTQQAANAQDKLKNAVEGTNQELKEEDELLNIIVTGSWNFKNYEKLEEYLTEILGKSGKIVDNIQIISSGRKGAGEMAAQFAQENGIAYTEIPFDEKQYGISAGSVQNEQMIQTAIGENGEKVGESMVIAFWDGANKGTRNMLSMSKDYGLETHSVVGDYTNVTKATLDFGDSEHKAENVLDLESRIAEKQKEIVKLLIQKSKFKFKEKEHDEKEENSIKDQLKRYKNNIKGYQESNDTQQNKVGQVATHEAVRRDKPLAALKKQEEILQSMIALTSRKRISKANKQVLEDYKTEINYVDILSKKDTKLAEIEARLNDKRLDPNSNEAKALQAWKKNFSLDDNEYFKNYLKVKEALIQDDIKLVESRNKRLTQKNRIMSYNHEKHYKNYIRSEKSYLEAKKKLTENSAEIDSLEQIPPKSYKTEKGTEITYHLRTKIENARITELKKENERLISNIRDYEEEHKITVKDSSNEDITSNNYTDSKWSIETINQKLVQLKSENQKSKTTYENLKELYKKQHADVIEKANTEAKAEITGEIYNLKAEKTRLEKDIESLKAQESTKENEHNIKSKTSQLNSINENIATYTPEYIASRQKEIAENKVLKMKLEQYKEEAIVQGKAQINNEYQELVDKRVALLQEIDYLKEQKDANNVRKKQQELALVEDTMKQYKAEGYKEARLDAIVDIKVKQFQQVEESIKAAIQQQEKFISQLETEKVRRKEIAELRAREAEADRRKNNPTVEEIKVDKETANTNYENTIKEQEALAKATKSNLEKVDAEVSSSLEALNRKLETQEKRLLKLKSIDFSEDEYKEEAKYSKQTKQMKSELLETEQKREAILERIKSLEADPYAEENVKKKIQQLKSSLEGTKTADFKERINGEINLLQNSTEETKLVMEQLNQAKNELLETDTKRNALKSNIITSLKKDSIAYYQDSQKYLEKYLKYKDKDIEKAKKYLMLMTESYSTYLKYTDKLSQKHLSLTDGTKKFDTLNQFDANIPTKEESEYISYLEKGNRLLATRSSRIQDQQQQNEKSVTAKETEIAKTKEQIKIQNERIGQAEKETADVIKRIEYEKVEALLLKETLLAEAQSKEDYLYGNKPEPQSTVAYTDEYKNASKSNMQSAEASKKKLIALNKQLIIQFSVLNKLQSVQDSENTTPTTQAEIARQEALKNAYSRQSQAVKSTYKAIEDEEKKIMASSSFTTSEIISDIDKVLDTAKKAAKAMGVITKPLVEEEKETSKETSESQARQTEESNGFVKNTKRKIKAAQDLNKVIKATWTPKSTSAPTPEHNPTSNPTPTSSPNSNPNPSPATPTNVTSFIDSEQFSKIEESLLKLIDIQETIKSTIQQVFSSISEGTPIVIKNIDNVQEAFEETAIKTDETTQKINGLGKALRSATNLKKLADGGAIDAIDSVEAQVMAAMQSNKKLKGATDISVSNTWYKNKKKNGEETERNVLLINGSFKTATGAIAKFTAEYTKDGFKIKKSSIMLSNSLTESGKDIAKAKAALSGFNVSFRNKRARENDYGIEDIINDEEKLKAFNDEEIASLRELDKAYKVLEADINTFNEKSANGTQMTEQEMKHMVELLAQVHQLQQKVSTGILQKDIRESQKFFKSYHKSFVTLESQFNKRDEELDTTSLSASGIKTLERYKTEYQKLEQMHDEANAKRKFFTQAEKDDMQRQIELVRRLGSELDSVDSQQYHQGNLIGTIKPGLANTKQLRTELIKLAKTQAYSDFEVIKFTKDNQNLEYSFRDQEGYIVNATAKYANLNGQVNNVINSETEYQGLLGKMSLQFKKKITEIVRYIGAYQILYSAINAIRQGATIVTEIDTAMTELRKTSEATEQQYKDFIETSTLTAKAIGSTTSAVISSAADWSRLGYTIEECGILAKNTALFMNVSGIEDISTATEQMTSTLKAYNITAEDSISIVDKFNEVGKLYCLLV